MRRRIVRALDFLLLCFGPWWLHRVIWQGDALLLDNCSWSRKYEEVTKVLEVSFANVPRVLVAITEMLNVPRLSCQEEQKMEKLQQWYSATLSCSVLCWEATKWDVSYDTSRVLFWVEIRYSSCLFVSFIFLLNLTRNYQNCVVDTFPQCPTHFSHFSSEKLQLDL